MEKLTKSQIEKLVIVLTQQFKGELILFGTSYSYNSNCVFTGSTKWVSERQKNSIKSNQKLGGAIFGKNIKGLKIWNYVNLSYSEFYCPRTLNIEMLKNNYSNGTEVILAALNSL